LGTGGQENIPLTILLNYTQEEFNLVETEYACMYIQKRRKEGVLIAAQGRDYTQEVCVISCVHLLIRAGNRIRQQAFPA
jgi:hypothetical protein